MTESESKRLAKRLIELIKCSRSEADKYIEGGWVLVDGQVVDEPQFQVLDQTIELHANASLAPSLPSTILLHVPEAFDIEEGTSALKLITPDTRSADDNSGIRTLKRHFARLMSTSPLEPGATGLLVFSQDSRVVNRLVQKSDKNEQEYVVTVSGNIVENGLKKLNKGMKIGHWTIPGAKVSWQNENRLRFALKNIRPGQIELMCKNVGLTIIALKRIRIGRVSMKKLPPGQWRYLPPGELF